MTVMLPFSATTLIVPCEEIPAKLIADKSIFPAALVIVKLPTFALLLPNSKMASPAFTERFCSENSDCLGFADVAKAEAPVPGKSVD